MSYTRVRKPRVIPDVQMMLRGQRNLPEVLARIGWPSLRKGQDTIINRVMGGLDVMGLLPTGMGKSGTFLIPNACLGWKTLVFVPLVALAKDQERSAKEKGFRTEQLSGSGTINDHIMRKWVNGQVDVLFAAPERMQNTDFRDMLRQVQPDAVTIDEAHTADQWADNFRPSYSKIGRFCDENFGGNIKSMLALTATSTLGVEQAIREHFFMDHAQRVIFMPPRTNLKMTSGIHSGDRNDRSAVLQFVQRVEGRIIVYCATRDEVEQTCSYLQTAYPECRPSMYHGGLPENQKNQNQDRFMAGTARVMCATNAFGMGIDCPDIRGVFHLQHPASIESLVQEYGRAGRDGKDSICMSLLSDHAINTHEFLMSTAYPSRNHVNAVYNFIKQESKGSEPLKMTAKSIAIGARVPDAAMRAIFSVMTRFGVIEKPVNDDNTVTVTFKNIEGSRGDEKFDRYYQAIKSVGTEDEPGVWRFDPDHLAKSVKLTEATVKSYLKTMSNTGPNGEHAAWFYAPAYRGGNTVLSGDVSKIDFHFLEARKKETYAKLYEVVDFLRLPDLEKQGYLDRYFNR